MVLSRTGRALRPRRAALGQGVDEPLHTLSTKPCFGLVTVRIQGEDNVIFGIGLRMLTKREQSNAEGFPADDIIDRDIHGRKITEAAQQAKGGNSLCPPLAEALARANIAVEIAEQEAQAACPGQLKRGTPVDRLNLSLIRAKQE